MKTQSFNQIFGGSTKKVRILVFSIIAFLALITGIYYIVVIDPSLANAFSGSGAGTSEDPYQVSTCSQLQQMSLVPTASYIFVNDIDCADTIDWNQGSGFIPFEFSGSLDGRNYSIIGLSVRRPYDYAAGLFTFIGSGGYVRNLKLTNSEFTQNQFAIFANRNVGALAGEIRSDATVENVHSEINVKSDRGEENGSIGGLVGLNRGIITLSSSSGNVRLTGTSSTAGRYIAAGGLVGTMDNYLTSDHYVGDSYATGTVTVDSSDRTDGVCGGLIGEIYPGTSLERSYSTGTVSCMMDNGTSAGGLIGRIGIDESQANIEDPTVAFNFTISPVNPGVSSNSNGFAGYTPSPTVWLGTNYYDATVTGKNSCVANQPNGCNAVNTNGLAPDYFKNSANYPLDAFNTVVNWSVDSALPVHKVFPASSDAPTGINVVRDGSDVLVSWEAPIESDGRSADLQDYQVFYRDDANNGSWTSQQDNYGTNLSATITGLSLPGSYSFKIRARNIEIGGGTLNGLFATAQISIGAPSSAPQNVQGQGRAKSVVLDWDSVSDASTYRIQFRRAGDIDWISAVSAQFSGTSATLYSLESQTSYQFQVQAFNNAGSGPWSETASLSTIVPANRTISNCNELQSMLGDLEANYTIINDIDCASVSSGPVAGVFEPIGNGTTVFNGSLNGNNHVISNLTISSNIEQNEYNFVGTGLFGVVAGATIQNVIINNSVIDGNYSLSSTIDADGNGIPDAPAIPSPTSGGLTSTAQDLTYSAQSFARFGSGGIAGIIAGWGNYSNLQVNNTVVTGPVSGSIFGAVFPTSVIDGTIITPDNVNPSLNLSNLSASGAVYGVVGGGLIGIGIASVSNNVDNPGNLTISNSQSSASVDANLGGGLVGVGGSLAALLPMGVQDNAQLGSSINTALSSQNVKIVNSVASGPVSTCNSPSGIRIGALGGVVGLGIGTVIQDSTSSGVVSSCSSTDDSWGQLYGGGLGGLGGVLIISRIENSHATGAIQAIDDSPVDSQVGPVNLLLGSFGGLVGVMVNSGDQNGKNAIEGSYATGSVEATSSFGGGTLSGGLVGFYLGSGTINNSYAKGAVSTTIPAKNNISLSSSGGLVGMGMGFDVSYVFGASFGTPVAATYGLRINNSYAEGSVTVNKVGQGQTYTTTGGLAGVLIGQVDVTNAYATGDAKLLGRNQQKIFIGDTQSAPVTETLAGADLGLNTTGGLVGSTWGFYSQQITSMFTGAADTSDAGTGILIDNTHASGNVDGVFAGGLIGAAEFKTKVNKSYAEGDVKGTVVGGLVGETGAVTAASSLFSGIAVSGSQTGFSGSVPILGSFIDSGFNTFGGVANQQNSTIDELLGKISSAVTPVDITNTYSTGKVNAIRPPIVIDGASVPTADGLTTSPPTIAGGLVGLFASPGGKLVDSYGSGTITVDPLPQLPVRKSGVIKPPNVPSFAGGITGLTIAMPKVNFEKIKNFGNPSSSINDIMESPAEIKNVFSASTLNIAGDTLTGGSTGVFLSPISIGVKLAQYEVDDTKLYQVDNIYFDQAKINVASCSGLTDAPELVYGIINSSYYPDENDANTLDSALTNPANKEEAKANLGRYTSLIEEPTTCSGVNKNNAQPNYFKNNKTNGPLPSWNFSDVWVTRKDDYPKFVAGASTTTPNNPVVPGSNTTKPNKSATAVTTKTAATIPSTNNTVRNEIAKFARVNHDKQQVKGLKVLLANVPLFVARSIPYMLILVLLLIASMYSWQAMRQYRQLKIYHKNILRIITTKESVDNYLAITTHYLHTPVAIMNGSVELLLSLKKISAIRANALTTTIKKFSTASEQLLVANQVSGAQSAYDEKTVKRDQINPLRVKEVWIPAVVALSLMILANVLFIYADMFNTSVFRIGIEIGLFILSVMLVALAYRYRDYLELTRKLAKQQLKLESELYKKREAFIPEASKVTSEHLESLQITSKAIKDIPEAKLFFNGLAMLDGINQGLINLKKFAEFNNKPPLFDVTTYAKKSVEKFSAKAKEKNVTIESKVDTGLVSRIQPEEIRQLVDSLLENAVKFSNNDTSVMLSIYRKFNKIVISVSDKGVGISEHKLPSLLKPFTRGTDSMQYNYEGVGLGLYSDKVIVDKLGGTISITSKLGKGTTTVVTIPSNYSVKESVPVLIMPDA